MPTSLIFVLLAAAWLVVLVPIVARRREKVPEMDESGARFRVLQRASGSIRQRRIRRPDAEAEEIAETEELEDAEEPTGPLDEELLDEDESAGAEPVPAPVAAERRAEPATAPVMVAERPRRPEPEDAVDDERYRPVPQRRGRGGYDPEAAERMRAYRYKRRRRVTAILLLAAVVFSLGAYFLTPLLWAGTAVFGLLLVGYLAYLRRQVRIEADIRRRRLAKMQRARQIRPEYHSSARRSEPTPVQVTSGQTTTSVPPAAYARNRQVVDLDDDDPGFDDLEYYEPYRYRRAAGQ